MNKAHQTYKRRLAWVYVPFGLFALFIASYCTYWFWMRGQLAEAIDEWIAGERARGVTLEYSERRLHGFPYRFALTLVDPVYITPVEGFSWRGETLQLAMQPWNFYHAIARAPGKNELSVRGGAEATAIIQGRSALSLKWNNQALTDATLALDEAQLVTTDGALSLESVLLQVFSPKSAPDDIRVALDWKMISLPYAPREAEWLGQSLPEGRLRLEVTHVLPALLADDTAAHWANLGGRAKLAQLLLNWGPLRLGMKGDLGLDSARDINGTLSFRLEETAALKAQLEAEGLLSPPADQILSAMEQAGPAGGFLPLSFRNGGGYFLGQKLFDVPTLEAPKP